LPGNLSAAETERLVFKFKVKFFKQKIDGNLPLLTFEEFNAAASGSSSASSSSSDSVKVPYQMVTVEAKEKHTATVIFMHGLGDQGVSN